MLGSVSIDLSGSIESKNHSTGDTVELSFEPKTRKVKGNGFDQRSNKLFEISGSWTESIVIKNIRGCSTSEIWKSDSKSNLQQYGFNDPFSFGLNQVTEEMKGIVAPTDSRFRPDQRALENGDIPLAEKEKSRLEIKQRNNKGKVEPQFFKEAKDETTGEKIYQYKPENGYWKKRERG